MIYRCSRLVKYWPCMFAKKWKTNQFCLFSLLIKRTVISFKKYNQKSTSFPLETLASFNLRHILTQLKHFFLYVTSKDLKLGWEMSDQTAKVNHESQLSYLLYIETVSIFWITLISNLESQLFLHLNLLVFHVSFSFYFYF